MPFLNPLKPTNKIITDFYVFDVEVGVRSISKGKEYIDWSLDGEFIFGVVYGHNFKKVIHDKQEFILEFQRERYKNKKVFAHNGSYDLDVLYGNIYKAFPDAVFNGKFICCSNGNCLFADSMNIFQTSIKKLGKMIGHEKTGMTGAGEYKRTCWSDLKERQRAIDGCEDDCIILYSALFEIFNEVGSIKITQASLSMDYFRRYFLPHPIEHNENCPLFFDSYYGGRCEAFYIGKIDEGCVVEDVNSMYPFIMRNAVFPNPKHVKIAENVTPDKLQRYYFKNYEGMAYCTVAHPETWLGLLPYKFKGKLLFPVGQFTGCWNFDELRFAVSQGVKIKAVSKVVYSTRMDSPFVNFVDTLYKKRFSTDNDFSIYRIKIFMNSLYGKFAQLILEEHVYIADMEKQVEELRAYQLMGDLVKIVMFNEERKDCFVVLNADNSYSKDFSIPLFASYITSGARVYLAKKMLEIGQAKIKYCDTDSVFYAGKPTGKSSKKLGDWKVEEKKVTGIYGLKNYEYWDKGVFHKAIKGVPKMAVEIAVNKYRYTNLLKTKEALRRGLKSRTLVERIKEIKNLYTKREVLKNGKTKPLKF